METLDENASVISASKVTGTNVYNTEGDLRGEIHDVMLDKQSGKIAYAIMSFGGFLGIGGQYHPLPWSLRNAHSRLLQDGSLLGRMRSAEVWSRKLPQLCAIDFCFEFARYRRIALLKPFVFGNHLS